MAVGIICEYNPFHNGHIYHLNEIKKISRDEPIILVLSGNFTQRGDISIIPKYDKTRLALKYGVDIVVELPFYFATESSDFFAKGSLEILNYLKCDKLIFGSESSNINKITELAKIQLNNNDYQNIIKEELKKGINYPTALSNALEKISDNTIREPNDLLALSYIKEIIKNNYPITPIAIKRTNDYNSLEISGEISSARSIRKALSENKQINNSVPKDTLKYLVKYDEELLFNLLKYKIISEKDLNIYQTVDEGIENKLIKEINNSNNIEELIMKLKTKRYTYNKIKRMLIHILCSFTKEERKENNNIKYLKILGLSNKGRKYLNKIKKELEIPIITNINKSNTSLLEIELRADYIYNLLINSKDNIYDFKPIIH